LRALALAAALTLLAATAGAAADPVRATARVDKDLVTLGERILLTIVVDMDEGWDVVDPGVARAIGAFEVVETLTAIQDPLPARGTRLSFRYRITTFTLGAHVVPTIELLVAGPGGARGVVGTEPIAIGVQGVIGPDELATDVRPLHPQLVLPNAAPSQIARIAAAGMAFFALAALVVLVAPLVRRGRRRAEERLSPVARALAEVDRIAELGLPEAGRYQEHYALLSQALRSYLAERYAIRAIERTPRELRADLERVGVERAQSTALYQILHEGEIVRFRSVMPYPAHARDTLRTALDLLQRAAAAEAYETARIRPL
jgi:hypothetical protein